MKKNNVILVTHVLLGNDTDIAGPAHKIYSYCKKNSIDIIFIRHAIFAEGIAFITEFKNGKETSYTKKSFIQKSELPVRLWEGYITLKYIWSLPYTKNVYIGVDPLNSLWGLFGKKLGKIAVLMTFAADYSAVRYSNTILNKFYYYLDAVTMRSADAILAVSNRILDVRRQQGFSERKLIWLPNSPALSDLKEFRTTRKDRYKIITVTTSTNIADLLLLVEAIQTLKQRFPKVKLTIIGSNQIEHELKNNLKKMKLMKNVDFLSAMPHRDVFRKISEHGIGIALYSSKASQAFYLDSMKARDYMALGLPVIISGDNGTTTDIVQAKAGIEIKNTKEALVHALTTLMQNDAIYTSYAKNALRLGEKRDSEKVLENLFQKIEK